MENEKEDGITLGELFARIFKHKIILAIITVLITVIGILFIALVFNKGKKIYTVRFNYNDADLLNHKYCDGTRFDYKSLVSEETLTAVKESNDDFKNINVAKMIENGDIDITLYEEYTVSGSTKVVVDSYYVLTSSQKYFDDVTQAKNFLAKVTYYPFTVNTEKAKNLDYTVDLEAFKAAKTYALKTSYLSTERSLILNRYQELINKYGDVEVSSYTGKALFSADSKVRLSSIVAEIKLNLANESFDSILKEYETNYYVYDINVSRPVLENQKIALKKDLQDVESKLNELLVSIGLKPNTTITAETASNIDISDLKIINDLIAQKTDIERQIKDVESYLSSVSTNEEYNKKLQNLATILEEYAHELEINQVEIFENYNNVSFREANYLDASGGISLAVGAVVSLILGFVVAACCNLIIDANERKKIASEPKKEEVTNL